MDNIGKILSQKSSNSAMMKGVKAAMAIQKFEDFVCGAWGQAAKDQAQALHVKNNILTVACLSATLANEIKLNQDDIMQHINSSLGIEIVHSIKIML